MKDGTAGYLQEIEAGGGMKDGTAGYLQEIEAGGGMKDGTAGYLQEIEAGGGMKDGTAGYLQEIEAGGGMKDGTAGYLQEIEAGGGMKDGTAGYLQEIEAGGGSVLGLYVPVSTKRIGEVSRGMQANINQIFIVIFAEIFFRELVLLLQNLLFSITNTFLLQAYETNRNTPSDPLIIVAKIE
jgi:hypothetical protein